jgi:hypothetical protein
MMTTPARLWLHARLADVTIALSTRRPRPIKPTHSMIRCAPRCAALISPVEQDRSPANERRARSAPRAIADRSVI